MLELFHRQFDSKMLRLFAIFSILHCSSAQVTFNCIFQNGSYDAPIGTAYTCDATVLQVGEGRNVVSVSGTHQPGWTNQNVRALRILEQPIDFMPENIASFFANLEAIVFGSTPIRSISSEDLRPFPELGYFAIVSGDLATVSGDVFMHTPKVEYSRFDRNRITNVGPGLFQRTPNMTSAFLHGNLCIDHSVSHSAQGVAEISQELAFKCPPTVEMTEEIILNGENFQQAVGGVVETEMTGMNNRVEQLENDHAALVIKHSATVEELRLLHGRVVALERIVCGNQSCV